METALPNGATGRSKRNCFGMGFDMALKTALKTMEDIF